MSIAPRKRINATPVTGPGCVADMTVGVLDVAACERTEASRRGRRSRVKGRVFERAVAKLLRDVYGQHIRRGWQSRSGREGCDVEGSRWWLELKHSKLVNLRAALKQALEDTDGRPVAVIAKDDRTEPVVLLRLADWLEREQHIVELHALVATLEVRRS